jgi:uncharacterized membrane protein YadS
MLLVLVDEGTASTAGASICSGAALVATSTTVEVLVEDSEDEEDEVVVLTELDVDLNLREWV